MKVIDQGFEVLYPRNSVEGLHIVKAIEAAARTCYRSEDKITAKSYERMVKALIRRGHEAMLEHGQDITARFTVSRAIANELVRHRLASFAQESTRYVRYDRDMTVIRNPFLPDEAQATWEEAMMYAEAHYRELLRLGVKPEIARDGLPLALATELVVKANVREWRHILRLRTDRAAHPQMRELMFDVLAKLQELVPVVFDGPPPALSTTEPENA